jgi:hypothetical protein
MGSWFFKNASIGNIGELNNEEDLNDLKYLVTKASTVTFQISSRDQEVLEYSIEFYKFLSQKFKFLKDMSKLKIKILFNIILQKDKSIESLQSVQNVQTTFLIFQKYINKYMFLKKWSRNNICNSTEKLLIKVEYNDLIFRIKELKNYKSPHLNFFSYIAFKNDKYDNESISKFLLNENCIYYEHLLPIFIQSENYENYIENIKKIIVDKKLNNIMLPPFIIKTENLTNLCLFANTLNNLSSQLNFFDLSFILYIENLEEIKNLVKNTISKFTINSECDYNFRFYIFTKFAISNKIQEIQKYFRQGISSAVPRKNSHIILYLFKKSLIQSLTNSNINPNIHDYLQDNLLRLEEEYFNIRRENLIKHPERLFDAPVNFRGANLLN